MKINSATKIMAVVLSVLMIFSSMVFATSAADFDSSWTAITNQAELEAIANNLAGKYYLDNDIILSGEWNALGGTDDEILKFTGTFDGDGHTIYGLSINCPTTFKEATLETSYFQYCGLFAANAGTIRNLVIDNPYIVAGNGLGAVAGANFGTISNCKVIGGRVSGSFKYAEYGYNSYYGTYDCYDPNLCYVDGYQVGAIAGTNAGTIEKCGNEGVDVGGWFEVGGITGENQGLVSQCYSTGNVNYASDSTQNTRLQYAASAMNCYDGYYYVRCGGIVGYNAGNGTIQDAYVSSANKEGYCYVAGLNSVGGICGLNSGNIDNVYAAGVALQYPSASASFLCVVHQRLGLANHNLRIDPSTCYVHYTAGSNDRAITDSFYSANASGSLPSTTRNAKDRGKQCASGSMADNKPLYEAAGWDFENVWTIDPSTEMPVFDWQVDAPECEHENTSWVDNKDDATHDKVCNDCGAVVTDNEAHTWGEWKVTTAVTCLENGVETATCTKCGAEKTIDIIAPGSHVDANKDHKCDVCGAAMGVHADTNGDHLCEYCGQEVTGHVDNNGDNHCDICDKFLGTGNGGLGSNGTAHSQDGLKYVYVDNNNHNGVCQTCGEIIVLHEPHVKGELVSNTADCGNDGVATYKCAKCEAEFTVAATADGNHVDADKDHKCDICGAAMGTHAAAEGSHNCAYCGNAVSACVDANKDHKCDVCGAAMGTHAAAEGSHNCIYCGDKISDCVDANKDHKCDICGAAMGVHADNNADGNCDYCGQPIGGGNTDPVDPPVVDPTDPVDPPVVDPDTCDHVDNDKDGVCDKCHKEFGHVDNDGDNKCDVCGDDMQKHCNCWCHREGKIYKAIYKIMRAFWKLFGINKYCKCGKNHFPTILDLIK